MFYSKSQRGFFSAELHGPRFIQAPDPMWRRPLIDVRLSPGETYGDIRNDGTEDKHLHQVPDLVVEHPVIDVPNPDCKIPEDAVEIEDGLYVELLSGQASGGTIVSDESGVPVVSMPKALSREQHREFRWEAIKKERDRRSQEGGFKVGSQWFHSDTFSRTQQMGLVMLGASLPTGIEWKTMGGAKVVMSPALAQQIFAAAAASDIAIFAAAEAHRAAMLTSADPATYDFSGGWPPVFGE